MINADVTPPKTQSKTKKRILETAISAFNQDSFGTVTVATLAKSLDMSEGNLWYHYKTKADLLAAIQNVMILDWTETFSSLHPTDDVIADYVTFFTTWTCFIERYLFMFRDRAEYGAHSPELANILPMMYDHVASDIKGHYVAITSKNGFEIAADDLEDLAWNIIIVTRFYLEFESEAKKSVESSPLAMTMHHMTLVKPLMHPDLFARLHAALLEKVQPSQ